MDPKIRLLFGLFSCIHVYLIETKRHQETIHLLVDKLFVMLNLFNDVESFSLLFKCACLFFSY